MQDCEPEEVHVQKHKRGRQSWRMFIRHGEKGARKGKSFKGVGDGTDGQGNKGCSGKVRDSRIRMSFFAASGMQSRVTWALGCSNGS